MKIKIIAIVLLGTFIYSCSPKVIQPEAPKIDVAPIVIETPLTAELAEGKALFVNNCADLEDITKMNVSIYPNPSTGKFNVNTKEMMMGKTVVTLYNVLGAKVHSQSIDMNGKTAEINAEGLPSGIYSLQLINNGKQYTQRVTVK